MPRNVVRADGHGDQQATSATCSLNQTRGGERDGACINTQNRSQRRVALGSASDGTSSTILSVPLAPTPIQPGQYIESQECQIPAGKHSVKKIPIRIMNTWSCVSPQRHPGWL